MENILEIRWHGRAGQGVKTASYLLAEAAMDLGKYIQAFPEYGPERMGAPMAAYTRISDEKILIHSGVENPDIIVVIDPTLVGTIDILKGVDLEKGIVIINSAMEPAVFREKLPGFKGKLATVDATGIALDTIGRPIPNVPMLGALIKVTNLLPLESVEEKLKHKFSEKFTEKIVEGNLKALERGYQEVRIDG
ncbi:pyruvate synthase [bacterium 3DAC]|nr:pyruvate synthase [Dictyoglomota bacterium]UZN23775.1 pyruvate synthase [bacterium 3DAC]